MLFEAGLGIFVLIVLGVVILFILMGIKMVPQGQEFTVEQFGKYKKTLTPGISFIFPIAHRIGKKINMMEQVMDVPSQSVITKDNAMVRVDGVAFYQINDAARAAYAVTDLRLSVLNLTMTNIRTVMGSMVLDDLLSKRDEINAQLLSVVDHATAPWGVKITRIEIKDIEPPKTLTDSMAKQMMAEREKRALVLEAQGVRESEILRAEGKKQSAILEAEGLKQAAILEAEARERKAEAEARATQVVSDAISRGDIQAINYFIAQDYVQAFGKIAESGNEKIIMMPMETSGILGSLAGITELMKSTGTNNGSQKSSPNNIDINPPKL